MIAAHAAAVAPEWTAVWETSMRKTFVGTMHGRTCRQQLLSIQFYHIPMPHCCAEPGQAEQDMTDQDRPGI